MDETNAPETITAEDDAPDHDDELQPGESGCRFAYLPPRRGDAS